MYRAWLHLTTAHDRLRSTARFPTASSFRALVHVQLTRLYRATTANCGTATPGTLYASPHPLHSTTGVRLANAHPTPLDTLDSPRPSSANFGSLRHPPVFWQPLPITHRVLTSSDARTLHPLPHTPPCNRIFPRNTRGKMSALVRTYIFHEKRARTMISYRFQNVFSPSSDLLRKLRTFL